MPDIHSSARFQKYRIYSQALTLALMASAALATGCSGEKTTAAAGRGPGGRDIAVPVSVARAVQKDIPIEAQVIGSVEPLSTVTLRPQISGQLMQAHFQEGDFVKAGQLLLTLDPRALDAQVKQLEATVLRDQAALGQAQANLGRDRAQQVNATAQLQRGEQLWKSGVISKEQYDQYVANAGTLAASIKADEAAIENAKAQIAASRASLENQKVQLSFTKIYSPIAGRTGTLLVKPGNVVTANTTDLATINQVQPTYVTFALPEAYLPELRRNMGRGLRVNVKSEENGAQETGTLAYFENTVDMTTGTIKLKAKFNNPNRTLWPGQFVRVTLHLGDQPNAIVVPSQAVQSGQEGTYVYVVDPQQKVEIRPVTPGDRAGDETVIQSGLRPGETVVTEGTLRLVAGAKVQIRRPGERPQGSRGTSRTSGRPQ